MTMRERVLSVLKRRQPDKVPWLGDLSYWVYYLEQSGRMPQHYQGYEGLFRLHADLGVGFYLQGYEPFMTHLENTRVIKETSGDVTTTRFETPFGTLTERWKYSPEAYCMAPLEHMVKGVEDLRALRFIYENTRYEPDYDRIALRRELAGDNGVTLCYTPKSPFMELVALRAGIETVTYCVADDRDEFESTLGVMEQKHDEAAQLTVNSACECVMIPENISSEVVGRPCYHRYMEAYQRKWTARIRERGKFSFVHVDGTLRGLLTDISNAGFDVLEALTPAPVGDMAIGEILAAANSDAIVWGGLPGAFFSDSLSDADFDDFVIKILEEGKKRQGFVLGVADQVPPLARPERIKRVGELVERYGAY